MRRYGCLVALAAFALQGVAIYAAWHHWPFEISLFAGGFAMFIVAERHREVVR